MILKSLMEMQKNNETHAGMIAAGSHYGELIPPRGHCDWQAPLSLLLPAYWHQDLAPLTSALAHTSRVTPCQAVTWEGTQTHLPASQLP